MSINNIMEHITVRQIHIQIWASVRITSDEVKQTYGRILVYGNK
jgi:hypothetical protein